MRSQAILSTEARVTRVSSILADLGDGASSSAWALSSNRFSNSCEREATWLLDRIEPMGVLISGMIPAIS